MVPYRLLKLNIDTHQLETIAEYDSRSFEGGLIFQDMTYDAATGTVYALAFDIDSGTMTDDQELDIPLGLFSLDVTTGTATRIKIYSNDTNMLTLSASSDGYLYAISGLGQLWDIQKSSGRLGDILCETGIYPATVQSAEFCPTDGKLYWTGFYATADASVIRCQTDSWAVSPSVTIWSPLSVLPKCPTTRNLSVCTSTRILSTVTLQPE